MTNTIVSDGLVAEYNFYLLCAGYGGHENAMNELPVQILENTDCSSMWLRVGIHVLDDQLCVGYGDTGACYVSPPVWLTARACGCVCLSVCM